MLEESIIRLFKYKEIKKRKISMLRNTNIKNRGK